MTGNYLALDWAPFFNHKAVMFSYYENIHLYLVTTHYNHEPCLGTSNEYSQHIFIENYFSEYGSSLGPLFNCIYKE